MTLTEEGLVPVPGLLSRWVRLGNGALAHYMTAGESGPPVIQLHGGIQGSSGSAGWRFMAPFLGQNGFRVYAPDQPGFGHADTDPQYHPVYGGVSHSDFIDAFATAVGLDRFHLAGNSMGADNTIQYVLDHPERVISFILIATMKVGDNVPDDKQVGPKLTDMAQFDGTARSMGEMITPIMYRPSAVPQELLEMRAMAANRQKDSYEAGRKGRELLRTDPVLNARFTTKDRFSKTAVPGIYLYGMDDVIAPVENAYNQEDTLPNIQFFYPEECGHQGQTDQPDMFNQVFLEFFRDGKVSRKTADWAGVSKRRPELPQYVEQA
ncbi:MAG: alpha/beta hydrolase [Chloroflexota bacterium]|nr:alpha/beta hydrolase [Chloroflexota bacterium]